MTKTGLNKRNFLDKISHTRTTGKDSEDYDYLDKDEVWTLNFGGATTEKVVDDAVKLENDRYLQTTNSGKLKGSNVHSSNKVNGQMHQGNLQGGPTSGNLMESGKSTITRKPHITGVETYSPMDWGKPGATSLESKSNAQVVTPKTPPAQKQYVQPTGASGKSTISWKPHITDVEHYSPMDWGKPATATTLARDTSEQIFTERVSTKTVGNQNEQENITLTRVSMTPTNAQSEISWKPHITGVEHYSPIDWGKPATTPARDTLEQIFTERASTKTVGYQNEQENIVLTRVSMTPTNAESEISWKPHISGVEHYSPMDWGRPVTTTVASSQESDLAVDSVTMSTPSEQKMLTNAPQEIATETIGLADDTSIFPTVPFIFTKTTFLSPDLTKPIGGSTYFISSKPVFKSSSSSAGLIGNQATPEIQLSSLATIEASTTVQPNEVTLEEGNISEIGSEFTESDNFSNEKHATAISSINNKIEGTQITELQRLESTPESNFEASTEARATEESGSKEFESKLKENEIFLTDKYPTTNDINPQTRYNPEVTEKELTDATTEEHVSKTDFFTTHERPTIPINVPQDGKTLTPIDQIQFTESPKDYEISKNDKRTTELASDEYGKMETIQLISDKTIHIETDSGTEEDMDDIISSSFKNTRKQTTSKSGVTKEYLDLLTESTNNTESPMSTDVHDHHKSHIAKIFHLKSKTKTKNHTKSTKFEENTTTGSFSKSTETEMSIIEEIAESSEKSNNTESHATKETGTSEGFQKISESSEDSELDKSESQVTENKGTTTLIAEEIENITESSLKSEIHKTKSHVAKNKGTKTTAEIEKTSESSDESESVTKPITTEEIERTSESSDKSESDKPESSASENTGTVTLGLEDLSTISESTEKSKVGKTKSHYGKNKETMTTKAFKKISESTKTLESDESEIATPTEIAEKISSELSRNEIPKPISEVFLPDSGFSGSTNENYELEGLSTSIEPTEMHTAPFEAAVTEEITSSGTTQDLNEPISLDLLSDKTGEVWNTYHEYSEKNTFLGKVSETKYDIEGISTESMKSTHLLTNDADRITELSSPEEEATNPKKRTTHFVDDEHKVFELLQLSTKPHNKVQDVMKGVIHSSPENNPDINAPSDGSKITQTSATDSVADVTISHTTNLESVNTESNSEKSSSERTAAPRTDTTKHYDETFGVPTESTLVVSTESRTNAPGIQGDNSGQSENTILSSMADTTGRTETANVADKVHTILEYMHSSTVEVKTFQQIVKESFDSSKSEEVKRSSTLTLTSVSPNSKPGRDSESTSQISMVGSKTDANLASTKLERSTIQASSVENTKLSTDTSTNSNTESTGSKSEDVSPTVGAPSNPSSVAEKEVGETSGISEGTKSTSSLSKSEQENSGGTSTEVTQSNSMSASENMSKEHDETSTQSVGIESSSKESTSSKQPGSTDLVENIHKVLEFLQTEEQVTKSMQEIMKDALHSVKAGTSTSNSGANTENMGSITPTVPEGGTPTLSSTENANIENTASIGTSSSGSSDVYESTSIESTSSPTNSATESGLTESPTSEGSAVQESSTQETNKENSEQTSVSHENTESSSSKKTIEETTATLTVEGSTEHTSSSETTTEVTQSTSSGLTDKGQTGNSEKSAESTSSPNVSTIAASNLKESEGTSMKSVGSTAELDVSKIMSQLPGQTELPKSFLEIMNDAIKAAKAGDSSTTPNIDLKNVTTSSNGIKGIVESTPQSSIDSSSVGVSQMSAPEISTPISGTFSEEKSTTSIENEGSEESSQSPATDTEQSTTSNETKGSEEPTQSPETGSKVNSESAGSSSKFQETSSQGSEVTQSSSSSIVDNRARETTSGRAEETTTAPNSIPKSASSSEESRVHSTNSGTTNVIEAIHQVLKNINSTTIGPKSFQQIINDAVNVAKSDVSKTTVELDGSESTTQRAGTISKETSQKITQSNVEPNVSRTPSAISEQSTEQYTTVQESRPQGNVSKEGTKESPVTNSSTSPGTTDVIEAIHQVLKNINSTTIGPKSFQQIINDAVNVAKSDVSKITVELGGSESTTQRAGTISKETGKQITQSNMEPNVSRTPSAISEQSTEQYTTVQESRPQGNVSKEGTKESPVPNSSTSPRTTDVIEAIHQVLKNINSTTIGPKSFQQIINDAVNVAKSDVSKITVELGGSESTTQRAGTISKETGKKITQSNMEPNVSRTPSAISEQSTEQYTTVQESRPQGNVSKEGTKESPIANSSGTFIESDADITSLGTRSTRNEHAGTISMQSPDKLKDTTYSSNESSNSSLNNKNIGETTKAGGTTDVLDSIRTIIGNLKLASTTTSPKNFDEIIQDALHSVLSGQEATTASANNLDKSLSETANGTRKNGTVDVPGMLQEVLAYVISKSILNSTTTGSTTINPDGTSVKDAIEKALDIFKSSTASPKSFDQIADEALKNKMGNKFTTLSMEPKSTNIETGSSKQTAIESSGKEDKEIVSDLKSSVGPSEKVPSENLKTSGVTKSNKEESKDFKGSSGQDRDHSTAEKGNFGGKTTNFSSGKESNESRNKPEITQSKIEESKGDKYKPSAGIQGENGVSDSGKESYGNRNQPDSAKSNIGETKEYKGSTTSGIISSGRVSQPRGKISNDNQNQSGMTNYNAGESIDNKVTDVTTDHLLEDINKILDNVKANKVPIKSIEQIAADSIKNVNSPEYKASSTSSTIGSGEGESIHKNKEIGVSVTKTIVPSEENLLEKPTMSTLSYDNVQPSDQQTGKETGLSAAKTPVPSEENLLEKPTMSSLSYNKVQPSDQQKGKETGLSAAKTPVPSEENLLEKPPMSSLSYNKVQPSDQQKGKETGVSAAKTPVPSEENLLEKPTMSTVSYNKVHPPDQQKGEERTPVEEISTTVEDTDSIRDILDNLKLSSSKGPKKSFDQIIEDVLDSVKSQLTESSTQEAGEDVTDTEELTRKQGSDIISAPEETLQENDNKETDQAKTSDTEKQPDEHAEDLDYPNQIATSSKETQHTVLPNEIGIPKKSGGKDDEETTDSDTEEKSKSDSSINSLIEEDIDNTSPEMNEEGESSNLLLSASHTPASAHKTTTKSHHQEDHKMVSQPIYQHTEEDINNTSSEMNDEGESSNFHLSAYRTPASPHKATTKLHHKEDHKMVSKPINPRTEEGIDNTSPEMNEEGQSSNFHLSASHTPHKATTKSHHKQDHKLVSEPTNPYTEEEIYNTSPGIAAGELSNPYAFHTGKLRDKTSTKSIHQEGHNRVSEPGHANSIDNVGGSKTNNNNDASTSPPSKKISTTTFKGELTGPAADIFETITSEHVHIVHLMRTKPKFRLFGKKRTSTVSHFDKHTVVSDEEDEEEESDEDIGKTYYKSTSTSSTKLVEEEMTGIPMTQQEGQNIDLLLDELSNKTELGTGINEKPDKNILGIVNEVLYSKKPEEGTSSILDHNSLMESEVLEPITAAVTKQSSLSPNKEKKTSIQLSQTYPLDSKASTGWENIPTEINGMMVMESTEYMPKGKSGTSNAQQEADFNSTPVSTAVNKVITSGPSEASSSTKDESKVSSSENIQTTQISPPGYEHSTMTEQGAELKLSQTSTSLNKGVSPGEPVSPKGSHETEISSPESFQITMISSHEKGLSTMTEGKSQTYIKQTEPSEMNDITSYSSIPITAMSEHSSANLEKDTNYSPLANSFQSSEITPELMKENYKEPPVEWTSLSPTSKGLKPPSSSKISESTTLSIQATRERMSSLSKFLEEHSTTVKKHASSTKESTSTEASSSPSISPSESISSDASDSSSGTTYTDSTINEQGEDHHTKKIQKAWSKMIQKINKKIHHNNTTSGPQKETSETESEISTLEPLNVERTSANTDNTGTKQSSNGIQTTEKISTSLGTSDLNVEHEETQQPKTTSGTSTTFSLLGNPDHEVPQQSTESTHDHETTKNVPKSLGTTSVTLHVEHDDMTSNIAAMQLSLEHESIKPSEIISSGITEITSSAPSATTSEITYEITYTINSQITQETFPSTTPNPTSSTSIISTQITTSPMGPSGESQITSESKTESLVPSNSEITTVAASTLKDNQINATTILAQTEINVDRFFQDVSAVSSHKTLTTLSNKKMEEAYFKHLDDSFQKAFPDKTEEPPKSGKHKNETQGFSSRETESSSMSTKTEQTQIGAVTTINPNNAESSSASPSSSESSTETKSSSPSESSTETKSPTSAESLTETKSPTLSESSTETKSSTASEFSIETKSPTSSELSTETKSTSASESSTETKSPSSSESSAETKSSTASEFSIETKSPTSSESSTETKSTSASESLTETKSPTSSESSTETKSTSASESLTETKSPTSSESSTETKSSTASEFSIETKSPTSSESSTETKSSSSSESSTETKSPSSSESSIEMSSSTRIEVTSIQTGSETSPINSSEKPQSNAENTSRSTVRSVQSSKISESFVHSVSGSLPFTVPKVSETITGADQSTKIDMESITAKTNKMQEAYFKQVSDKFYKSFPDSIVSPEPQNTHEHSTDREKISDTPANTIHPSQGPNSNIQSYTEIIKNGLEAGSGLDQSTKNGMESPQSHSSISPHEQLTSSMANRFEEEYFKHVSDKFDKSFPDSFKELPEKTQTSHEDLMNQEHQNSESQPITSGTKLQSTVPTTDKHLNESGKNTMHHTSHYSIQHTLTSLKSVQGNEHENITESNLKSRPNLFVSGHSLDSSVTTSNEMVSEGTPFHSSESTSASTTAATAPTKPTETAETADIFIQMASTKKHNKHTHKTTIDLDATLEMVQNHNLLSSTAAATTRPGGNGTCSLIPINRNISSNMSTSTSRPFKPLFIALPTYWPNSTWQLPDFEMYYPKDEEDDYDDQTLNPFEFRSMKLSDFINITEYPLTSDIISAITMQTKKIENTTQLKTTEPAEATSETPNGSDTNVASEEVKSSEDTKTPTTESMGTTTHEISTISTEKSTDKNTMESSTIAVTTSKHKSKTHHTSPSTNLLIKSEQPCIQNKSCICSVDSMVKYLQANSKNPNATSMLSAMCDTYIPLNETGIKLDRSILRIRRHTFDYDLELVTPKPKRDIIAGPDIKDALNKDIQLDESDTRKYATVGSSVNMVCASGKNFSAKEYRFSWVFGKNCPLTGGKILERPNGDLTIGNIEPCDGGTYTCSVINKHFGERTFQHELFVITLPLMDINTTILYEINSNCQKEDEDLLQVYINSTIGNMLCGKTHRICKISIVNCSCFNKEKSYISISLVFHIEDMYVIVPTLNTTQCNVVCQMKIYAKLISVMVGNIMVFETQPVLYRHSRDVILKPSKDTSLPPPHITEGPQLIISCPPGYGLLDDKHICRACGKNTFNAGGQAHCLPCPSRQYQPSSGSKACLKCSSPLQDPACFSMLVMQVPKYKKLAYAGLAFMVLIVLCIVCVRGRRRKKKKKKNERPPRRLKKRRPGSTDIEMQTEDTQDNQVSIAKIDKPKRRYLKTTRAPPIPAQRDTGVTVHAIPEMYTTNWQIPPTPPPPDF